MQNVKKIFIDEGLDLVNELESLLIELESNGASEEIVNGIFRIMHSLKGGSSMFGFQKLDELTHNLETIYNIIRDDYSLVSDKIIELTFKSVDLIKSLLSENINQNTNQSVNLLIGEILELVNKIEHKPLSSHQTTESVPHLGQKSFYILFRPEQNILKNGTEPLYITEELVDLSEDSFTIAHTSNIPPIEQFDTNLCYTWWELVICSKASQDEIESVFMFVEDEAEIEIKELSPENILSNESIRTFLEQEANKNTNQTLNLNQLFSYSSDKTNITKTDVKQGTSEEQVLIQNMSKNDNLNIKVSSQKLDELMNMVSELVTTQARLQVFSDNSENPELSAIAEEITKITLRLRDNAFSIILIPIESVLIKYRRLVRDLSISLDKPIQFNTEGTDTELDKTIIETINEPLLHLIRNCIDHGIERKEERLSLGKPEQGTISLKAYYSGSNVHIEISDDGAGLNLNLIRQKAIEKEIIDKNTKLSNKEIIELIWLPGFSTAKKVSELSGRGVGMDVVKKKISDVRGEIDVKTEQNKGTTFTLKLPLTLSIIDGLLVEVNNIKYIIQLSVIEKIHKINHSALSESFNDFMVLDNQQIPYIYLRDVFAYTEKAEQEHVIVVRYEDKLIGIVVDAVIGEYQAVLKPLGHHYNTLQIFSGGTILGDGNIALVLDTNKIIKENS
jgi:two-component system chemotaxis sensor kinase CheA